MNNPTQIQFAARYRASAVPLVLIHDGGGTTFAYYSLGPLHRNVWVIDNPNYTTGKVCEGGIDEMARTYIDSLKKANIKGPLLLGGWSLGGLLSITIAHLLSQSEDHGISCAGLVLIDAVFHYPQYQYDYFSIPEMPDMPLLARRCFDQCVSKDGLLYRWELPKWNQPTTYSSLASEPCKVWYQPVLGLGSERPVPSQEVPLFLKELDPEKPAKAESSGSAEKSGSPAKSGSAEITPPPSPGGHSPPPQASCPPAVLIRCSERVPIPRSTNLPARVDQFRDSILVGWEFYAPQFIKAVIDVEANHFNIFKNEKVMTAKIIHAIKLLGK